MSSSAVEQILRIVAALEPHGPQYPGKPPKKRDRKRIAYAAPTRRAALAVLGEKGDIIGHAHIECGASQTQTRSMKLNTFQPIDIAGAIGMARLEDHHRWLLRFIAGDESMRPLLRIELASSIAAQAAWMKWQIDEHDPDRIADLVLDMLIEADGCTTCNVTGSILDRSGQLIDCPDCRGSGHISLSERGVARRWKIAKTTYRRRYMPAVQWACRLIQGHAGTVLEKLRDAGA